MNSSVGTSDSVTFTVACLVLLAGVIDDLRSRKFHNWLFLTCAAFASAVTIVLHGTHGFAHGGLGFAAGIGVFLPLVLLRALGAGDMKLLGALGIIIGWSPVVSVALYALIWGAVLGLTRALVTGQFTALAHNVARLAAQPQVRGAAPTTASHRIPFTVAILFGWLSYLTIGGV